MSRKSLITSNINIKITAVMLVMAFVCSLICSCNKTPSDFDGVRFAQTRHISVNVDSINNSSTTVNNSLCAKYIHDAVLQECNIDIDFVSSSSISVAYGMNTDIMVSSDYNTITTYYRMGSVINISPYLNDYSDSLSDLINLLGTENLLYCSSDPYEIWYLSQRDFDPDARVTFIRRDWLDKLNLKAPSTREELHNCLVAFRDNADLLLGDNSSEMIPFFVDNEPAVSAKPLFDSLYDPETSAMDFYVNGFNRSTQEGYKDGLQILNSWYLEGLLPSDFSSIRPLTKESYEPIEYGYVGAFCAKYDYLYMNGDNSHIKALHDNCGAEAEYIAVNTFENSRGDYTYWHEDYLSEEGKMIYLPSVCTDPLACLVYLNWISNPSNIEAIQNLSNSNTDINDAYTYDRYLITCDGQYPNGDLSDIKSAEQAKLVAFDVKQIQQMNKCIRYGTQIFPFTGNDTDYASTYPESAKQFTDNVISASEGTFESVYNEQYEKYLYRGAIVIVAVRESQWDQVMVQNDLEIW